MLVFWIDHGWGLDAHSAALTLSRKQALRNARCKSFWMKTKRSLQNYCYRQNRVDLDKAILLFIENIVSEWETKAKAVPPLASHPSFLSRLNHIVSFPTAVSTQAVQGSANWGSESITAPSTFSLLHYGSPSGYSPSRTAPVWILAPGYREPAPVWFLHG